MIAKGDLNLRTSNYILDHRKIYLLKSDDGRTRVIKASANMSGRAWNGEHIEHYEYDDTPFCYEEYEKDFETAIRKGKRSGMTDDEIKELLELILEDM